jgi:hypothetical protein
MPIIKNPGENSPARHSSAVGINRQTQRCRSPGLARRRSRPDRRHAADTARGAAALELGRQSNATERCLTAALTGRLLRIGPEPCVCVREDADEASAGERIGQPSSRERFKVSGADVFKSTEGKTGGGAIASRRSARRGLIAGWQFRVFSKGWGRLTEMKYCWSERCSNGLRFDGGVRTVFGIQFLHYTTHMDFDGAFAHTEFIGYDFI